MSDYRSLEIWRRSFNLCKEIYLLTKSFPKEERYALVDQMRRASVSIPSNIAEGKGRMSDRELRRFCLIAYGSAMELETQLLLSKELGYVPEIQMNKILDDLSSLLRQLNRFVHHLSQERIVLGR